MLDEIIQGITKSKNECKGISLSAFNYFVQTANGIFFDEHCEEKDMMYKIEIKLIKELIHKNVQSNENIQHVNPNEINQISLFSYSERPKLKVFKELKVFITFEIYNVFVIKGEEAILL